MSHEPSSRTLVVVGGVAGGASAVTRARRTNEHARIIMLEKDSHVSFANCGLPYYLGGEIPQRDDLLVVTPARFEKMFNVEVRTRCEVTGIDRDAKQIEALDRDSGRTETIPYDKLILATGAEPIRPPLPGGDATGVFTLRNLEDTDAIHRWLSERRPKRAVVVGAGYIGLEMAEQMAERGLEVDLVELQPQVLPLLDEEMAGPVAEVLEARGVRLHLGTKLASVETERVDGGDRVRAVTLDGGGEIPAELVIVGIGVKPNVGLAKAAGLDLGASGGITVDAHLRTSDPDIYAVGDAVEYVFGPTGQPLRIPLAGPANRAGRLAGEHAATDHSEPMAPVFGASIVRVFDLAAASTGMTMKLAERMGVSAESVVIQGLSHAEYFPGARPLLLKLVYAPDTGRILGAQAVGEDGVDKRIDVISTAMMFGSTVEQLAGLDLAYAPPYGAAKDPVHLAGMAAANTRAGLVAMVQPHEKLEAPQILDVRPPDQRPDPVDWATHIPLPTLRGRLDELDRDAETITICNVGRGSYNAARILMQHGFSRVRSATGGMRIWARRGPRVSPGSNGG